MHPQVILRLLQSGWQGRWVGWHLQRGGRLVATLNGVTVATIWNLMIRRCQ